MKNLITIDQVSGWLKLEKNKDEDFIKQLIEIASYIIYGIVKTNIHVEKITEIRDGDGTNTLLLKHWPVYVIDSINIDADRAFGLSTLVDPSDYFVDRETGEIELYTSIFSKDSKNVKIIYHSGYSLFEIRENVNDAFDLSADSIDYNLIIPEGLYTDEDLASSITAQFIAAGLSDLSCSYLYLVGKFKIESETSLQYTLKFKSGINSGHSICRTIGFDSEDLTGSEFYSSEIYPTPPDIINSAQQIIHQLYDLSKKGQSLLLVKEKSMPNMTGTTKYITENFPPLAIQILQPYKRISL